VLGQHPAKALDIRQFGHGRGLPDPPSPHAPVAGLLSRSIIYSCE
jgi:hypothetical protein